MLDDVRERLYAVYLNQNMRPTGYRLISAGGRASAPVDIPTIFGPAVALQASSIAVIHNHPSGNMTPSPQDLALTKAIKDAGNLLNIRVVEHLVVGGDGKALAFSEKGLL
jgi:DNA repair protein RadC